jgi:hypothetical protein
MTNSTTDQLRDDIDSGRTGDKVPASDPAAAPLATDDEAAGKAPTPQEVDKARRQEVARPPTLPQQNSGARRAWLLIVLAMICLGLLFAWALGGF